MFAGPNGSGKSTVKDMLPAHWLGAYINADDLERDLRAQGNSLDLSAYGISCSQDELREFFERSTLLEKVGLLETVRSIGLEAGRVIFGPIALTSYHAAVLADFIRRKLLAARETLSFETVMSGPDKVALLCEAQRQGYRTYLYYVATDDPTINLARVALRVELGGHDVPDDKVVERYHRSLDKLVEAIRCTDRAYVFDNTGDKLIQLAEITGGVDVELQVDEVPQWFDRAVLSKLAASEDE